MNDLIDKYFGQYKKYVTPAVDFISTHLFTIIIVLASAMVLYALMQSRTYLNPPRNEAKYNEERLLITTSTIDEEIVAEIRETLEDATISVSPALVPGRNNPFIE